ncbi:hypothetical protein N7468_000579 [Penicillium chermesinum]|uniref:Fungal N-terminal domain-containing protein n=1 Tax=Penicillium chermesinum TaxID=63820 RepID=A0A9W9PMA5_9EURO|nr:uncharacterized protein N7468_000579 [Penicillium chermesinum]KAJ5249128.1 hypothetical protein N7468_000579 [Penicillium chermesinum]
MGDPLSLTGTAVGIVSLGLSVCQGLVSYYSALRSYSQDTKNVINKLEGLKDVLAGLEALLQRLGPLQTETAAIKTAERHILACRGGLSQLKEIMDKCEETSSGLQRGYSRALYPFRRDTIGSVLKHVESLQSNLDTSMHILSLQVSPSY